MLISSRVAQGVFGAIMIPQVLSVIQVIFPAGERIKALAAFGVTAGLGTVSGPLLGGLLTQHNLFGLGGGRSSSSTCQSASWLLPGRQY